VGQHQDQELEGASNTRFRQVRAAISVILYVLLGCIALDCIDSYVGSPWSAYLGIPALLYISQGAGFLVELQGRVLVGLQGMISSRITMES
jgi:hypothetical protein